jgi:MFS family permease
VIHIVTRLLRSFPKPVPAAGAQIAPPTVWRAGGGGAVIADTGYGGFFGWRIVAGAFVLAGFGWGIGFYGPPVFLSVIGETRGWPLMEVSAAVTVHFLIGAVVSANLPRLYRRYGAAAVTKMAALCLAAGVLGWAGSTAPWQLFLASLLSGAGWGAMSAAAVNGIVAPWFVRARPAALGMAYNGASIGGMIFSPLWVAAIATLGFPNAATLVAVAMGAAMWVLADQLFSRTPQQMGLLPDGDTPGAPAVAARSPMGRPLPGALLWHDRQFLTLAAGMALGLFAQIGLTAHLFSLLVPALGGPRAGLAMATMNVMAIAGRMLVGWAMPLSADRRLLAAVGYMAQLAGSLVLICAAGTNVPLLLLGVVLFGIGFGNATSLPPLVAQSEFAERDMQRVVALIVGMSQGIYAFAPALFGLVREFVPPATEIAAAGAAPWVFAMAALIQGLAIAAFLLGRKR